MKVVMLLLIVLEGQDCTGKTSLAPKLIQFLSQHSFIVESKSFPERTPFITKYLNEGSVSGIPASTFQMACFLQKMNWQRSQEAHDKWWVLDRWSPSGTVYGFLDLTEDIPENISELEAKFNDYIAKHDLSYRLLEKPVIGLIFTASPESVLERQAARGGKPSVYESIKKQATLESLFKLYAMRDRGYKIIDTTDKTQEDIYNLVVDELKCAFSL